MGQKHETTRVLKGRSPLFQGAVERDQLAASGFRTAGLSSRQSSVLCVSQPARLPFRPQDLAFEEAYRGFPSVPESDTTVEN